jgi:alpha-beta hydrolase superfamily lysophospholipase
MSAVHLALAAVLLIASPLLAQTRETIRIRGREQTLHVYGPANGAPVIVSSGDGGWIHLAPHVAELLARRGFFVLGFDTKAYLASFTSGERTLRADEEPGDFRVLTQLARVRTGQKAILVGVSEGAGLSVLAATDPQTKQDLIGVVGLGLPDMNELGWRWKDAIIYLTHRPPDEPSFSAAAAAGRVAPLPLAAIHSTHDEFVPAGEVQHVMQNAGEPKRLWMIEAADHRFSDNLGELDRRLVEAIGWVAEHRRE